jgi:hypothetical protein
MFQKVQKYLNNILDFGLNNKWLSLVIVFLLTRLPVFLFPVDNDHYIFYLVGKRWFEGAKLYVDVWEHKPPLAFIPAGIMSLISDNIWVHRIIAAIIAIVTVYLFYKFLQASKNFIYDNYSSKLEYIFLVLFIFIQNLAQVSVSGDNTENYALPIILYAYTVYFNNKDKLNGKLFVLFGVITAVLFFLKPTFIIIIAPIFIKYLIDNFKDMRKIFAAVFSTILGLVIVTAPIILYFYFTHTLQDFWVATYSFNSKYVSVAWTKGLTESSLYLINSMMLFLPGLLGYLLYILKNRSEYSFSKIGNNYWFIVLWGLIPLATFVMTGAFFTYYILVLIPFLLLGYQFFWKYCIDYLETKSLGWVFYLLVASMVVFSLGYSIKQALNAYIGYYAYNLDNMYGAAEYVKKNTTPDDYIAFNRYGATFYEIAERKDATRFVSLSHVFIDYDNNFGYKFAEKWVEDMERNKPKYVIQGGEAMWLYNKVKPVSDYINKHYKLENDSFGSYGIYRRID